MSVPQWWGSVTLSFTSVGKYSYTEQKCEHSLNWKESDLWAFDLHLDHRRKGMIPGSGPLPTAGNPTKLGLWSNDPQTSPMLYSFGGDGEHHRQDEAPGEILKSHGTTDRTSSRSAVGASPPNLALLQTDVAARTYSFLLPMVGLEALNLKTHDDITRTMTDPNSAPQTTREIKYNPFDVAPVTFQSSGDIQVTRLQVLVLKQKLPDSVGPLSGSVQIPAISPHDPKQIASTVTVTLSWNFSPKPPPPIELEIEGFGAGFTPWDQWRPTAGPDEQTPTLNAALIRAKVVAKGGALPDKPEMIEIRLSDVSHEKGICINYPEHPQDPPEPDLMFRQQDNPSHNVRTFRDRAWVEKPRDPELVAHLACFDYGAWGEVSARAVLESGRILIGHVKDQPSEHTLKIPKRRPGSKIAVVWNSPGADADDKDDQPQGLPDSEGDGLTNYEEYRGFYVKGQWQEGDPARKDFFVVDMMGTNGDGIDLWRKASKLRVHELTPGELSPDRIVNFNHTEGSLHKVDQHGILIKSEPALGTMCQAHHKNGKNGQPKEVLFVGVGTGLDDLLDTVMPDGSQRKLSQGASGLAHELGHCCNVFHHGDEPQFKPIVEAWTRDAAGTLLADGMPITVYDPAGNDVTAQVSVVPPPGEPARTVRVDVWQGQCSGDVKCLMRYQGECYIPEGQPLNIRVRLRFGADQTGGQLCTSPAATGTNLVGTGKFPNVGYYGPCAPGRGNCALQILVNDAKPFPSR